MSVTQATARLPYQYPLPYARWAALVLILAIEVVAVGVHVETGDMPAEAAWSVGLIMNMRLLARPAIFAAIAATCLAIQVVHATLLGNAEQASRRRSWPFLLGHVAAMGGFAWLTDAIIAGWATSQYADLAVAAWFACGALALALWASSLLPWALWRPVIRGAWKPLAGGICAGALAMVVASSTAALWADFHRSTFRVVNAVLGLFFRDRVCDPGSFALGVGRFYVRIAPACSGYEGIGLIWVFLGVYLFLFRRELRFPSALLLLPVGTAIIWFANIARITGLILIGAAGYPELAVGGFHSQSGWIAFNVVGLGLVLASRSCGLFRKGDSPSEAGVPPNPTMPYVLPLIVLVATTMLTAAISPGSFDLLYPARVVAIVATLWYLRRRYAAIAWPGSWVPVAIGVAVFAAWMAMEPAAGDAGASGTIPSALRAMSPIAAVGWVAFRILGSVVTVPIVEELAFRGFLLRWLVTRDFEDVAPGRFTWIAILVSSACFGALHGRWLAGFVAGVAYAMAYRHRGKVGDAVVAHAVTNGLIAGLVLATGAWSLWT